MSETLLPEQTRLERALDVLLRPGLAVFALAIIAFGIENLVCAQHAGNSQGFSPRYSVVPVIPWLPAIPWLALLFGAALAACGVGLLFKRSARTASMLVGVLLFVPALIVDVPKYAGNLGDMGLRTTALEPVAIAALAWLLPGRGATPDVLARGSRYLLALLFVVFGVDHFLALAPIGTLVPAWIPWHVFWIAFFGAGFIAAGLSIAFDMLLRWGAACIGLMFAIWVFTLHLPRVLGLYGIPGAPHNPDEWSSLFIAVALWGGSWALARVYVASPRSIRHPAKLSAVSLTDPA